MIDEDSNTSVLADALTSVVGGTWQVAVELAGAAGAASPTPAEPDPRDDTEPGESGTPVDPEADAVRLLESSLGARRIADAS
jgi:hypothetical protein